MNEALNVVKETFFDWWNSMVGLAVANIVWLVAAVTIFLLPPATAGMYYITHSLAKGMGQRSEDFIEGARKYLWISYRWFLINVVVAFVIYTNFTFYLNHTNETVFLVGFTFTGALTLVWISMQFYTWPFLMAQEDKRLTLALKNALLLTLGAPGYNLIMLLVLVPFLMLSFFTLVPLAFFTIAFVALLGNTAVLERLKAYEKLQ